MCVVGGPRVRFEKANPEPSLSTCPSPARTACFFLDTRTSPSSGRGHPYDASIHALRLLRPPVCAPRRRLTSRLTSRRISLSPFDPGPPLSFNNLSPPVHLRFFGLFSFCPRAALRGVSRQSQDRCGNVVRWGLNVVVRSERSGVNVDDRGINCKSVEAKSGQVQQWRVGSP